MPILRMVIIVSIMIREGRGQSVMRYWNSRNHRKFPSQGRSKRRMRSLRKLICMGTTLGKTLMLMGQ